jgi:hypothetical protein
MLCKRAGRFAIGRRGVPLVAAVSLLVGVACRRDQPQAERPTVAKQVSERVVPPDQPPPTLVFPPEQRSKNESLNAFIEEFQEICAKGEYLRYRSLVSREVEPFDKDQFVAAWHAVERVSIELVRRLPRLESLPDPAYGVLVHVLVRESAQQERLERSVALMVFREPDENQRERWVVAPAPEPIRDALREEAAREHAEQEAVTTSPAAASRSDALPTGKTANAPESGASL